MKKNLVFFTCLAVMVGVLQAQEQATEQTQTTAQEPLLTTQEQSAQPEQPAKESGDDEQQNSKISISGFGYFMFGQIVSGIIGDGMEDPQVQSSRNINKYWQDFGEMDVYVTAKPVDWYTSRVGFIIRTYLPLQYGSMDKASYYMDYKTNIPVAEGIFNWNFLNTSLLIESGLFQYTFNPQIKNLGNYLFRTTVHPMTVQSKVDYTWADLMGVRAQVGLLDEKVKIEAILNSINDYPPWYDWNLGLTARYVPNKIIDVGAAVCFSHAFQVGNTTVPDSLQKLFKGTKLNARAIFDPKPLLGDIPLFGAEDLRLYGELAVLDFSDSGDYPWVPKTGYFLGMPLQRMPILLGFNLPAFKVLDVAALEFEWFKSPYPNDWYGAFPQARARDFHGNPWELDNYYNKDNFKWSVYLKKSIQKFEIRAIAANDHSIYKVFKLENVQCFEQTLKRPSDWQWFIQLRYNM